MAAVITDNRVKELRARHDITQQQLADFLGISVLNLRRREKSMVQWKENEMHLVTYFLNNYFSENFKLDDIFTAKIIE